MDEYRHADAIGFFLTGAESDGGSQTDPDLSLGSYRGSTYIEQRGFFLEGSITGVKIERLGGANGEGAGFLETIDGDSLRWTAPGGTAGPITAIADGETKLLESGGYERSKFVIASRHTTSDLKGQAVVMIVPVYNSAVGSSNVSHSEREAGEIKLRCIAVKAVHATHGVINLKVWVGTLGTQQVSDAGQLGASGAGTIETTGSLADWPESGFCRITESGGTLREIVYYSERTDTVLTIPAAGREQLGTTAAAGAASDTIDAVPGLKIAAETPAADQFSVADDENDTSEVSGFSWSTGTTEATGLDIGDLAAGEMAGLWLWLIVVADATVSPSMDNLIKWSFDA